MYSMGPSGVGYGYWGCAAGITRIKLFNAHRNPLSEYNKALTAYPGGKCCDYT